MRTGIELIKLILHASGPDAAALLTANLPVAAGPDAASPADNLQQWRMVAARVGLSPEQRAALADWRTRFLQRIDDCYGRRLLLKAQLAQLPGASGSQWVEALLLQSAESAGYSGAYRCSGSGGEWLGGWCASTSCMLQVRPCGLPGQASPRTHPQLWVCSHPCPLSLRPCST